MSSGKGPGLLFFLLLASCFPAVARSQADYPLAGWAFGSHVGQRAPTGKFMPRYQNQKLVGLERLEYSGSDSAKFEAALGVAVERFRSDFGGATFGTDAATLAPVPYDLKMEATLLHMLRQSPQLAEEIRAQGGGLTTVFEIRPAQQPANANLYLHAIYAARSKRYEVRLIVDAPGQALRKDLTGMQVDMAGDRQAD